MSTRVIVTVNTDEQIVLQVASDIRVGDTWYLGLQSGADATDRPDVKCEVIKLIHTWIQCIASMSAGDLTWLPFDFSDEYTRWLACRFDGESVHLRLGWCQIEGWAVSPFDPSGYHRAGRDFRLDDSAADDSVVYRPALLSQLRSSIAQLRAAGQKDGF